MKTHEQKLKELKSIHKDEIQDLEKNKMRYFLNTKDMSIYVYPEKTTKSDKNSKNLKEQIDKWKMNDYELYKGKLDELPSKIFLRFIGKDGKIRMGFVLANKTGEKYFMLQGVGGARFGVEYDVIKDTYYKKEHYDKQRKKLKEAEKKKQEKAEKAEKAEKQKAIKNDKEKSPDKKTEKQLKKPTAEEVNTLLTKIYYDEGNYNGRDKLYSIAKERHPKITRAQVEKWLSEQKLYQLTKPNKSSKTFTPIISKAPFNVVQIDIYKYGKIITLNMVDLFSKYVDTYVMKNETAQETINAVKAILKKAPLKPKLIQSDNGPNFTSKEFTEYLSKEGIKQIFSTPYTPQSQGAVERLQKTLKAYLEKLTLQNKKITNKSIDVFDKNYNNTKHTITGMTPMEALKDENREKVLKAIEKAKAYNLTEDRKDDLKKNDKVRLSTRTGAKNENIGAGSLNWTNEVFTIHSISRPRDVLKPIRYKVKDTAGEVLKGIFYRNELQHIEDVKNADKVEPKYEVEKFVKRRIIRKKRDKKVIKTEWLIRWKGYTSSEDTWEDQKKLIEELGKDVFQKLKEDYLGKGG